MPNLLTGAFGIERSDAFTMQSAAIIMQMAGCILAGLLADRFGAGKVILIGSFCVAAIAGIFIPVWVMCHSQPFYIVYAARTVLRYGRYGVLQYGQNVPCPDSFFGNFIFL